MNKILNSFGYAMEGVLYAVKTQLNFRIELCSALILFATYFMLDITLTEWMIVIVSVGFVLTAELINTAIEVTCDLISIKYNLHIKNIKDIAAGSVLFCLFVVVAVNAIVLYRNLQVFM